MSVIHFESDFLDYYFFKVPLARIYFNQTVADNLIPFLPQNNNLLQIFHGDLTVTKDEHTVINTQVNFSEKNNISRILA